MASISNSSPTDDNTSGTDLSNIYTEEEEQIDMTDWTPAKQKETTAHGIISQRIPCFWRKSFHLYYNREQNYANEPPYA